MPSACVVTGYGPPDVLEWENVPMPEPSATEIRIKVRVSGVGPTDLKIRRGDVQAVFPLPDPAVLGFETAGTVDAVGSEVGDVAVGDEVAALLPSLGGYAEYALAAAWTRQPPQVSWKDAGGRPSARSASSAWRRARPFWSWARAAPWGWSPRSWRFVRGSRSSGPSVRGT